MLMVLVCTAELWLLLFSMIMSSANSYYTSLTC